MQMRVSLLERHCSTVRTRTTTDRHFAYYIHLDNDLTVANSWWLSTKEGAIENEVMIYVEHVQPDGPSVSFLETSEAYHLSVY